MANGRVAQSVTELIGQTPIVKLNRLSTDRYGRCIFKIRIYEPGEQC